MRISVVSVPVSDQEAAKRYYVDGLGFEVLVDAEWGGGNRWVQVGPPGGGTTLTLVTWFPEMPPGSLRDVEVDGPREMAGGRFGFVSDPDGNRINLRQTDR